MHFSRYQPVHAPIPRDGPSRRQPLTWRVCRRSDLRTRSPARRRVGLPPKRPAVLQQVVHGIATDDLAKPTPCREFDVAALTDHLLNSITSIGSAAGARPPQRNPADSVERQLIAAARPALDAWHRRAGRHGPVREPEAPHAGSWPASCRWNSLVHAWDYATAIGRPIARRNRCRGTSSGRTGHHARDEGAAPVRRSGRGARRRRPAGPVGRIDRASPGQPAN